LVERLEVADAVHVTDELAEGRVERTKPVAVLVERLGDDDEVRRVRGRANEEPAPVGELDAHAVDRDEVLDGDPGERAVAGDVLLDPPPDLVDDLVLARL